MGDPGVGVERRLAAQRTRRQAPVQPALRVEEVVVHLVGVAVPSLEVALPLLHEIVGLVLVLEIGQQGEPRQDLAPLVEEERPGGLLAVVFVVAYAVQEFELRDVGNPGHVAPVIARETVDVAAEDRPAAVVFDGEMRHPSQLLLDHVLAPHQIDLVRIDQQRVQPQAQVQAEITDAAVGLQVLVEPLPPDEIDGVRQLGPLGGVPGVVQLVVGLPVIVDAVLRRHRVEGAEGVHHRLFDPVIRQLRLFTAGVDVHLRARVVGAVAAAPEQAPLLAAGPVAIAVALEVGIAQHRTQAAAQFAGPVGPRQLPGVVIAQHHVHTAFGFPAVGVGDHVHRAADRGGRAHRIGDAALDLDILQAAGEIGHVHPVDLVVLRIVEGDAVDHHADAFLVESPDLQGRVADAVSGLAGGVESGRVLHQQGDVQDADPGLELRAGDVGVAHVDIRRIARGADHDILGRIGPGRVRFGFGGPGGRAQREQKTDGGQQGSQTDGDERHDARPRVGGHD